MDHAITVGMVADVLLAIGDLVAVGGILIFLLWLLNPFRTGH
jgi:hypothetical protein